ncbi:hypothetical protein PISMIDRAFT_12981 [Pisolithus microcarpus 441]|uniref:Uncharacterized protein n=1 Tax=Pisolithus microcarpus 441 TaxID=765257 RepID=A0A0C9ZDI2_9AGAM|nr:hypothetical protein PISMIDRAFT_12981 [Pisolithus microcarpus 441]
MQSHEQFRRRCQLLRCVTREPQQGPPAKRLKAKSPHSEPVVQSSTAKFNDSIYLSSSTTFEPSLGNSYASGNSGDIRPTVPFSKSCAFSVWSSQLSLYSSAPFLATPAQMSFLHGHAACLRDIEIYYQSHPAQSIQTQSPLVPLCPE